MRIIMWFLVLALAASVGANKILMDKWIEAKAEVVIVKDHEDEMIRLAVQDTKWEGQQKLDMSIIEFQKKETKLTKKIDSLFTAKNIKVKGVISVTETSTEWEDTTRTIAKVLNIEKQPTIINTEIKQPVYKIVVADSTNCWVMRGEIKTIDPNAVFTTTYKHTSNTIHQVITKEKRFLFIRIKKARTEFYSDCGEPLMVNVTFKDS